MQFPGGQDMENAHFKDGSSDTESQRPNIHPFELFHAAKGREHAGNGTSCSSTMSINEDSSWDQSITGSDSQNSFFGWENINPLTEFRTNPTSISSGDSANELKESTDTVLAEYGSDSVHSIDSDCSVEVENLPSGSSVIFNSAIAEQTASWVDRSSVRDAQSRLTDTLEFLLPKNENERQSIHKGFVRAQDVAQLMQVLDDTSTTSVDMPKGGTGFPRRYNPAGQHEMDHVLGNKEKPISQVASSSSSVFQVSPSKHPQISPFNEAKADLEKQRLSRDPYQRKKIVQWILASLISSTTLGFCLVLISSSASPLLVVSGSIVLLTVGMFAAAKTL